MNTIIFIILFFNVSTHYHDGRLSVPPPPERKHDYSIRNFNEKTLYKTIDAVANETHLSLEEITKLIELAEMVKQNSYSVYSKFRVGCSILTKSGKYYSGTNVENISYGLSVCSERIAIFNSVSAGEKSFKALLLTSDTEEFLTPCGACRQVIAEFGNPLNILMNVSRKFKITSLEELLPGPFNKEQFNIKKMKSDI